MGDEHKLGEMRADHFHSCAFFFGGGFSVTPPVRSSLDH